MEKVFFFNNIHTRRNVSRLSLVNFIAVNPKQLCKNVLSQCKNLPNMCKILLSQCRNLLSQCKNLLSQYKNLLSQCRNLLSQCKNLLSQCRNLLSQCKNPLGTNKLILPRAFSCILLIVIAWFLVKFKGRKREFFKDLKTYSCFFPSKLHSKSCYYLCL